MDALDLSLFVSLCLTTLGLLLFLRSSNDGNHQHSLRLALLPLREDQKPSVKPESQTDQQL